MELAKIAGRISPEMMELLRSPREYTGKAQNKTLEVIKRARRFLETNKQ